MDQPSDQPPNTAAPNAQDDEDKCAICLNTPTSDNMAAIHSCGHMFCIPCVIVWSLRRRSCPLCHKQFTQMHAHRELNGSVAENPTLLSVPHPLAAATRANNPASGPVASQPRTTLGATSSHATEVGRAVLRRLNNDCVENSIHSMNINPIERALSLRNRDSIENTQRRRSTHPTTIRIRRRNNSGTENTQEREDEERPSSNDP